MCHYTIEYQSCMVILGALYILMGLQLNIFSREKVYTTFQSKSQYLMDHSSDFNTVFSNFLRSKVNSINLPELLPFVQYASKFFSLSVELSLPKACKEDSAVNVNFISLYIDPKLCLIPL